PVVYEFSADPVAAGIATDLAHPLFNATGITLMKAELNSKRIELLHEIAPTIHRVAVIGNPLHPGEASERTELSANAKQLDIEITFFATANRAELDRALAAMSADLPQAIIAFSDGFVVENRSAIIDFSMSRRLPLVSGWAVMANFAPMARCCATPIGALPISLTEFSRAKNRPTCRSSDRRFLSW